MEPAVTAPLFRRYVAIGDSSTEGIDDPDGLGGYRGWSRRLAEHLADGQPELTYANLAVRGVTMRQVRDRQLGPALALRPDLATVFSGTNDVVGWRFDLASIAADMEAMQRAFADGGATVLTFTLPDLTPIMPLARPLAPRIRAMNAALHAVAARTGAMVVDFAAFPVAGDRRLWSADRIHANAAGHERMAQALAHALGVPGAGTEWQHPLPPEPPRSRSERWRAELAWAGRHFGPWLLRLLARPATGAPVATRAAELAPVRQVAPLVRERLG